MEIELTIVAGQNLAVRDLESSDPYIKFKVGDKKFKTTTKDKTLQPKWNESFTIQCQAGETIVFNFYDKDTMTRDDEMGHTKWVVPHLYNGVTDHFLIKNTHQGHLYFTATCLRGGKDGFVDSINFQRPTVMKMHLKDFLDFCPRHGLEGRKVKPYWFVKAETPSGLYAVELDHVKPVKKQDDNPQYSFSKTDEVMYFQGKVGDEVKLTLYSKQHHCVDECSEIATTSFIIPDYQQHQTLYYSSVKPYSKITHFAFSVECLRSIYLNANPQFLPPELSQAYLANTINVSICHVEKEQEVLKDVYPNSMDFVFETPTETKVIEVYPTAETKREKTSECLKNDTVTLAYAPGQKYRFKIIRYADKVNQKANGTVVENVELSWSEDILTRTAYSTSVKTVVGEVRICFSQSPEISQFYLMNAKK